MWGQMIGLGIALALQPLPALAAVILLSVDRGVVKATAFFLGEFSVMFVIGVGAVALEVGTVEDAPSNAMSIVKLVAGVVLLVLGVRFILQSRRPDLVKEPGWLARLDRMEPWPAFLLGLFLPTYVLAIAAGAHIVESKPGTSSAIVAMLVFLVIGTSTVYVPILLAWLVPHRSEPIRLRVRDWLVANWVGVAGGVLLLVGGFLVAKSAVGLA